MSRQRLVVVGGGEHACVVIDAALSRPDLFEVVGFSDVAARPETSERMGVPWLGDDAACLAAHRGDCVFVLGTAGTRVDPRRAALAGRYTDAGARWAAVVHRTATVSATASIGEGAVVMAGAVVNTGARIGAHCVINTGAVIEHDVVMEDFCQAGPAAALGGGASVGAGSYLGLGCRVRDHVALGAGVTVGMGAVVVGAVADGAVVVGIPARPRGGRP